MASDDFTGTNGVTIQSNNPDWTNSGTGDFVIQNNKCENQGTWLAGQYRNTSTTLDYSEVVFSANGGEYDAARTVNVRMSSTSAGYGFQIITWSGSTATGWQLLKNGSWFASGSMSSFDGTVDNTVSIEIESPSNDIVGKVNGTEVFRRSDGSLLPSGNPGISGENQNGTNVPTFDDWNDGNVASGITGTLNSTLEDFTLSASGSVSGAITGNISSQTDDISLSSSAIIGHTASVSSSLDPVSSSTSGIVGHQASLSSQIDAVSLSASGNVGSLISGSVSSTLDNFSLSSSAVVGHTGSLTSQIESFQLISSGILGHTASLSDTVDPITLSASGIVSNGTISGNLSEALEDFSLISTGILGRIGDLSELFEDFTLSASGNVLGSSGGTSVHISSPLIYSNGNESSLPIYISVSSNGGIIGLTSLLYIRDSSNPLNYLDFSDLTFKTSGWINQSVSMLDYGSGVYGYSLNVSGISQSLYSDLILEYRISGAVSAVGLGNIIFTDRAIWGNSNALTFPLYMATKF